MYISNRKENGQYIDQLPDGEMQFHIDQCYVDVPPKATILYSMNIPSSGGDTLFSNNYKAYEFSARYRQSAYRRSQGAQCLRLCQRCHSP